MNISWVISENFKNNSVDLGQLKEIGSIWGSWKTWKTWSTDNVLCHDKNKAHDLIKRAFQAVCNLYIHKKHYASLERPPGISLYDGEFPEEFDQIEDIIAMHLVASQNDIVLLLGFDLSYLELDDKFENHKRNNYLSAFKSAVAMYPDTQYVVLDHDKKIVSQIFDLENITCDTYENVLQLLNQ